MNIINGLKNYQANWIDVVLIKIAVIAATLFFAKVWNQILSLDWYWYSIVWMIAAIKPFDTFYKWLILAKDENRIDY